MESESGRILASPVSKLLIYTGRFRRAGPRDQLCANLPTLLPRGDTTDVYDWESINFSAEGIEVPFPADFSDTVA